MAGLVTAFLNVRLNILHLLASILTMIALYSINLRIMGRPNIALLQQERDRFANDLTASDHDRVRTFERHLVTVG